MHVTYRGHVLVYNGIQCSAAFFHISQKTADKPNVGRCINEDLDVQNTADTRVFQNKQSFQNQYVTWFAALSDITAGMMNIVIWLK